MEKKIPTICYILHQNYHQFTWHPKTWIKKQPSKMALKSSFWIGAWWGLHAPLAEIPLLGGRIAKAPAPTSEILACWCWCCLVVGIWRLFYWGTTGNQNGENMSKLYNYLLNIEFYIKLILKLLESQCQPEIHTIHSWLFLLAYLTVEAHLQWAPEDYLNCSWICVIPWQQMPTDWNRRLYKSTRACLRSSASAQLNAATSSSGKTNILRRLQPSEWTYPNF